MPRKTPPFPEYPAWTTSRYWSFIRSGLRSKFNRWPPKYDVLNEARRIVKGKRHKYEYQCARCNLWFKRTDVEVDHIKEVGSLKSSKDLKLFVERMFVGTDKLQVLCKECHKEKTTEAKDGNT